ncbi:MAG TPA: hypothetical protein VNQ78_19970, partial [Paracoccus sp. (in: a-proteobacteria)]|uniref:hypothetical protein n=1 Tax=Paracoccus sp. TaxID=267 RepID=UPI002CD9F8CA
MKFSDNHLINQNNYIAIDFITSNRNPLRYSAWTNTDFTAISRPHANRNSVGFLHVIVMESMGRRKMPTGTNGNDTLYGNALSEVFDGLAGNDVI